MSTIYKCDKCGKIIEGDHVNVSFNDGKRRFFENIFNSFHICESCAKSFAVKFKNFLKIIKKAK